jgi:hypothetical protein
MTNVLHTTMSSVGTSPKAALSCELSFQPRLLNRAAVLLDLGRSDEAIHAYADVVSRYGDAEGPTFLENVARALYCKAEAPILTYDDLISRFNRAQDDIVARTVASAKERRTALIAESN